MKPITRANFAIGAEKEKQYGYRINEKCIGCGLCTSKCPQNCIDTLSIPFRIRENNCLHCGNCMEVCPNNAVEKIKKAAKYIKEADYILIGAGAGLSTAAGLTYDGVRFKKNFPKFIEKYGMKDMYSFSIK